MLASIASLAITGVMILVMPFFQGGLLGMADEALGGRTDLGTLVSEGRANYFGLLLAYLAVLAVNLVFGFIAFVGLVVGGIGLFAAGGAPDPASLGAIAVVGLLFVLAYLLFAFFVQFYAHAIVLSDSGLVEGFKRSVGLVRRNLLSVIGYTIILVLGGAIFGGVGGAASVLLSPQAAELPLPDLSLPVLIGAAVVYVLAIAVLGAFYAAYSVAFYRSIDATDRRPENAN